MPSLGSPPTRMVSIRLPAHWLIRGAYAGNAMAALSRRDTLSTIGRDFGTIRGAALPRQRLGHGGRDRPTRFRSGVACQRAGRTSRAIITALKSCGTGSLLFLGAPKDRGICADPVARRRLAESMAKQRSPTGIPVAPVLIGRGDLPETREGIARQPHGFCVQPEDVAANVYELTRQPGSIRTFEAQARLFAEKW